MFLLLWMFCFCVRNIVDILRSAVTCSLMSLVLPCGQKGPLHSAGHTNRCHWLNAIPADRAGLSSGSTWCLTSRVLGKVLSPSLLLLVISEWGFLWASPLYDDTQLFGNPSCRISRTLTSKLSQIYFSWNFKEVSSVIQFLSLTSELYANMIV